MQHDSSFGSEQSFAAFVVLGAGNPTAPIMAGAVIQFCLDPSQSVALEEAAQGSERAALAGADSEPRCVIGSLLANCGLNSGAMRLLKNAIAENYCSYTALQTDPLFMKLKGTPEFRELLSVAKGCRDEFVNARNKPLS